MRTVARFLLMDHDQSPDHSPPDHERRARDEMATMVASSAVPNMPGPMPLSKRYRPAPAKTFQCRGYGECRMVFSRSEHLARHIRCVLRLSQRAYTHPAQKTHWRAPLFVSLRQAVFAPRQPAPARTDRACRQAGAERAHDARPHLPPRYHGGSQQERLIPCPAATPCASQHAHRARPERAVTQRHAQSHQAGRGHPWVRAGDHVRPLAGLGRRDGNATTTTSTTRRPATVRATFVSG